MDKLYYFPKASASYRLPSLGFVQRAQDSFGVGQERQPAAVRTEVHEPHEYRLQQRERAARRVGGWRSEHQAGNADGDRGWVRRVGVRWSRDVVGDCVRQDDRRPDHPADVRAVRGFTNYFTNGASLQNRGIESMLQLTPVRFRRGEWNTTVIYQKVKPKITDLNVPTFRQGGFALFLGQYQVEKGKSPTQIVGLVPTDTNPNVSVAAIVGDATPDYQMSFNNEISFGPFHASALLDYKHGGDNINLTTFLYDAAQNSADWNTKGKERFALQGKDTRPYVEDGSFVKLREVSVSYRVPESFVQRTFRNQVRTASALVQRPQSVHELRVQGTRSRGEQLRKSGAQSKRRCRAVPAVALVLPLPRHWLLIHDGIHHRT